MWKKQIICITPGLDCALLTHAKLSVADYSLDQLQAWMYFFFKEDLQIQGRYE